MSTTTKVSEILVSLFLLALFQILASRLPKFVDQQMNNQITEGIRDEILPLKTVPCFQGKGINCFQLKKRPRPDNWTFAEFQISTHNTALRHSYRLYAYKRIPEVFGGGEILLDSRPNRADPILMDIIIDITPIKSMLMNAVGEIYFILFCDDCGNTVIEGKNEDSIGFVILKRAARVGRVRRSVADKRECSNDGDLERCCVNKRLSSKALIFDNHTNIVAPLSIPVTFCSGSCYLDMYRGNHNFALIKYYQSRSGDSKRKMMKVLPCCNAARFRDLAILYVVEDGSPEMIISRNLIVDSCACV